jgi:ribosomal protein S18
MVSKKHHRLYKPKNYRLYRFVNVICYRTGKILPRRATGVTVQQQRKAKRSKSKSISIISFVCIELCLKLFRVIILYNNLDSSKFNRCINL